MLQPLLQPKGCDLLRRLGTPTCLFFPFLSMYFLTSPWFEPGRARSASRVIEPPSYKILQSQNQISMKIRNKMQTPIPTRPLFTTSSNNSLQLDHSLCRLAVVPLNAPIQKLPVKTWNNGRKVELYARMKSFCSSKFLNAIKPRNFSNANDILKSWVMRQRAALWLLHHPTNAFGIAKNQKQCQPAA